MAELTKTVDGKPLTADQFAYIGNAEDVSTWHLPIDKSHLQSALDMFGHEKNVPQSAMGATARKIAAKAKDAGLDTKNFEAKYCRSSDHADFGNGWIEIFRAGSYGEKGKFTAEDLDRIVRNYDPSFHEAPACIGHPQDDLPAYGWADRLMRQDDTLLAKFKEVEPNFEAAVKAGRYKKRSAAFYLDGEGRITNLRHVAFLGAQPPEVKGLKNLNFDDKGREFTEVDFGEESAMPADEKSMKDQIKAFFVEMFGQTPQSKTFSEDDVKRIATEAVSVSTASLQAKIAALETDLKAQTARFSEREIHLVNDEAKQRSIAAGNRLKSGGHWVPAFQKMGLPLVFDELAKTTATVEFGEGDAKKKITPLEALTLFLEGFQKIVPDGRTYTGAKPGESKSTVAFTEGKGVKADSNSIALNEQAVARAKEKSISFGEALEQIVVEHPELTLPGGSQAGVV